MSRSVTGESRESARKLQVAIDGPVAAGKSSLAKKLAEKLGILYVDTGAMYRAVALACREMGVEWSDEAAVVELVNVTSIELDVPEESERDGRLVTVLVNGKDVSNLIRNSQIAEGASVVSTYAGVREVLVAEQQLIANDQAVVMEGRDIGTRVLPEAQLKIYLEADQDERVRRKWKYLEKIGEKQTLDFVKQALETRDMREMTREVDPLRPADDAWRLDTTGKSLDEVVSMVLKRIKEIQAGGL